jgi:hypothetical protein
MVSLLVTRLRTPWRSQDDNNAGSAASNLSHPTDAPILICGGTKSDVGSYDGIGKIPDFSLAMIVSQESMAGAEMVDTNQVPVPNDHDDTQAARPGAGGGSLGSQSEVVWILGDTVSNHVSAGNAAEMHLPADGYLALDAVAFADAPANLDHALHQLTIATDLFDVPVLDFDSYHS